MPPLPCFHPTSAPGWSWQRHSYLRWGLALAVGIGWAHLALPAPSLPAGYVWPSLLALLVLCHVRRWPRWFGAAALVAVAWAGLWLTQLSEAPRALPWPEGEADYRLMLTETPSLRGHHLRSRAELQLVARGDGVERWEGAPECSLYLPADSLSATLRRGDCLWVRTTLGQRRGMGVAFVAADCWQRVGPSGHLSLWMRLAEWRERLLAVYGRWGFSGRTEALLSALTLGDQSGLDADLRASYRQAGAAHVLALSGLHIGMVALMVMGLFRPLVRWSGWFHYPALLLSVAVLWLYAGLTGGSPSALRATLLFTLLLGAGFPMRQRLGSEVLLATAFWMCVCRPEWLFDIGFQLSFAAVASLLLLQPLLASLWHPRSAFGRALWGLVTAALAAQAGTAPLVAFYFGSLPVHFLFTSLWVVPWTSLLLAATALLWLLTPWPGLAQGWAAVVEQLVGMQHTLLQQVAHWPMATWGPLEVDEVGVVLAYVVLVALRRLLRRRTWPALLLVGKCLLLLMGYEAWLGWEHRPQRSLCFYNVRACPSVCCLAYDGRSWIACADSLAQPEALAYASEESRMRRLAPPVRLPASYEGDGLLWREGILTYAGRRVCLLSDRRWHGMKAAEPLRVDYLLVCRGYWGRIGELQSLFAIGQVVLHPSLSRRRQEELAEECRQLGLPLHSLARQGTLRVPLP